MTTDQPPADPERNHSNPGQGHPDFGSEVEWQASVLDDAAMHDSSIPLPPDSRTIALARMQHYKRLHPSLAYGLAFFFLLFTACQPFIPEPDPLLEKDLQNQNEKVTKQAPPEEPKKESRAAKKFKEFSELPPEKQWEALSTLGKVVFGLNALLVYGGVLGLLCLVFSLYFSNKTRTALADQQLEKGPPLGINLPLLFLTIGTWIFLGVVTDLFFQLPIFNVKELKKDLLAFCSMAMIARSIQYVMVIAFMVFMARRFLGKDGSAGVWPFWKNEKLARPMNLLQDFKIAGCIFMLGQCGVLLVSYLNNQVLQFSGKAEDQNPLLDALVEAKAGSDTVHLIILFLGACLIIPIVEEIIFRGVLYNALRNRLGFVPAAIISSSIFSFVHGVDAQVYGLFFLSMLFTYAYQRTGRIFTSALLHIFNNTMTMFSALCINSALQ